MISELKDEDILDFLMNSDLEGNYSPEELKYLLLKWKYFYRTLHGRLTRVKDDSDGNIKSLTSEVENLKSQITQLQLLNVESESMISSLKNRKLTWKERLKGEIITNKNETSRV